MGASGWLAILTMWLGCHVSCGPSQASPVHTIQLTPAMSIVQTVLDVDTVIQQDPQVPLVPLDGGSQVLCHEDTQGQVHDDTQMQFHDNMENHWELNGGHQWQWQDSQPMIFIPDDVDQSANLPIDSQPKKRKHWSDPCTNGSNTSPRDMVKWVDGVPFVMHHTTNVIHCGTCTMTRHHDPDGATKVKCLQQCCSIAGWPEPGNPSVQSVLYGESPCKCFCHMLAKSYWP